MTVPLLSLLDRPLLEHGLEHSWLVQCPPGTRIITEGEYDIRFFVLLEGTGSVSIDPARDARRSFLNPLLRGGPGWNPLDEPAEDDLGIEVAELHAGDFFGELACMSPWPHTATVTARTEAIVLEVEDDVFEDWMRGSEGFCGTMEEAYRSRGVRTLLRRIEAFAALDADALEELARGARTASHATGDTILAEGDNADALYIVRGGTVALSKRVDGLDRITSYRRAGSYFGETALLRGSARTATVRAASAVELVVIARQPFLALLEARPEARAQIEAVARTRAESIDTALHDDRIADALAFVVNQGLLDSPDLLVVDLDRCTRCGRCEAACEASHGACLITLHGPVQRRRLFPTACRHCSDPRCLLRCPVDAIGRDAHGEAHVRDHCIGCGRCQRNCPFGTISLVPLGEDRSGRSRRAAGLKRSVTHRAAKCDRCEGIGTYALCVRNCPTGALRLTRPESLLRPSRRGA